MGEAVAELVKTANDDDNKRRQLEVYNNIVETQRALQNFVSLSTNLHNTIQRADFPKMTQAWADADAAAQHVNKFLKVCSLEGCSCSPVYYCCLWWL